jgi:mono/diheme cytochrome c family protein
MPAAIALLLLVIVVPQLRAQDLSKNKKADSRWVKVSVSLPDSVTKFPAGDGAEIATSQCLICHSAGMVLRQPALSDAQWRTIINKMRTAYGAPLPAEQVGALAAYLSKSISEGGGSDSSPTTR